MEKGVVWYRSKYGAAKRYAHWLAEAAGFTCGDVKKYKRGEEQPYQTVVFCGGIYAGGLPGVSHWQKMNLQGKRTAVLCVGASPYDESLFAEIKQRVRRGALEQAACFYARGAWDESAMSLVDRTLCRALIRSLQGKDPKEFAPWEAALVGAAGKRCDWTDRAALEPLLAWLRAGEVGT